MKINTPVTGKEIPLTDDRVIVSKTDRKGIITYVNRDFVEISGFTEPELVGKNHNIIRHPDMPPAAFQDLWNTLKQDRPWTGIVKNRAKNGDHYWVEANIAPVSRDGRIVEYISVRRPATREQIEAAETLYQRIGRGKSFGTPWYRRLNPLHQLTIRWQFTIVGLALSLLVLVFLGLALYDDVIALQQDRQALAGVRSIEPLRRLLQDLPQHRGMTNAFLNGEPSFKERILEKQQAIADDLQTIRWADAAYGGALEVRQDLGQILTTWQELRAGLFQLSAEDAFKRHTALIAEVIALIRQVGDRSRLILELNLDRYYLADLLINQIPPITDYLGLVRGLGAGVAAAGGITPAQRQQMSIFRASLNFLFAQMDRAVQAVYDHNLLLKERLQQLVDRNLEERAVFTQAIERGLLGRSVTANPKDYFAKGTRVIDTTFALFDEVAAYLEEQIEEAIANRYRSLGLAMGISLTIIVALLTLGWRVIRRIHHGLSQANYVFGRMIEGHYFDPVELERKDEIGDLLRGLKAMQTNLGFAVIDAQKRAASAMRIKTALDCVSTNVMVADKDHTIIYLNSAVQDMFRDAAADLRELIPDFDPDRLVGESIDRFHRDSAHHRAILESLSGRHQSQLTLGPRTFRIIVDPVVDADGARLGTAVEWTDLTLELRLQREAAKRLEVERRQAQDNGCIRTALDNVSSGVLVTNADQRVIYLNHVLEDMLHQAESDICRDLPQFSMERLIGSDLASLHPNPTVQRHVLKELQEVHHEALEFGGHSFATVTGPVIGTDGERLGIVMEWTEQTAEVTVEREIAEIVAAAHEGDLERRITIEGKEGFHCHLPLHNDRDRKLKQSMDFFTLAALPQRGKVEDQPTQKKNA